MIYYALVFILGYLTCYLVRKFYYSFLRDMPLQDVEAYERGLKEGLSKGNDPKMPALFIEMKKRADHMHRRAQFAEGLIEGFSAHVKQMIDWRTHFKREGKDLHEANIWLRTTMMDLEKDYLKGINRYKRRTIISKTGVSRGVDSSAIKNRVANGGKAPKQVSR